MQKIVRKFTNYRNQIYLKSDGASNTTPASVMKTNTLLKLSPLLTGRQLFAQEQQEAIAAGCKQRMLDTGHTSPAAVYQQILKERWDALSDEKKSEWNDRAHADAGNVMRSVNIFLEMSSFLTVQFASNQEKFAHNINLALRDLCQGKILGDAEMVLFYAFREPDTGDLLAGTYVFYPAACHINISRLIRFYIAFTATLYTTR